MIVIKNSLTSKTLEPTDYYAQHSTQWVEGKQSKATFLLRFPSFSSIPYTKMSKLFYLKIGASYLRINFNTADVTAVAKVHSGTIVSIYTYIKIFKMTWANLLKLNGLLHEIIL